MGSVRTIFYGEDMIGAKGVIYISPDAVWEARYFSKRPMIQNWVLAILERDPFFNATFIVGSHSTHNIIIFSPLRVSVIWVLVGPK